MSLRIAGLGWVTPLGATVAEVWEKLCAGSTAEPTTIGESLGENTFRAYQVPPALVAEVATHPRLRRSSAISRFAVLAGLNALRDAALDLNETSAARTALIFAISNGGVIYTRRFYQNIVESGAAAASPLLFPETVFNAPASHLAAILGITGATYTLVGDGAVGILALKMAEELMTNSDLDRCLVVGAEEADWLLCDAYQRWRLVRAAPPIEPFARIARGMLLSEGAGAVVVGRAGKLVLDHIHPGRNFGHRRELAGHLDEIARDVQRPNSTDVLVVSANGTFIDQAEEAMARNHFPDAVVYAPKPALGESVGASALWQLICAAQALKTQQLPPLLHVSPEFSLTTARNPGAKSWRRAVVTTCGLNQQVAMLGLQLEPVSTDGNETAIRSVSFLSNSKFT
jgi:3-oxoacyl-(acyl-carrier-protein) synthase